MAIRAKLHKFTAHLRKYVARKWQAKAGVAFVARFVLRHMSLSSDGMSHAVNLNLKSSEHDTMVPPPDSIPQSIRQRIDQRFATSRTHQMIRISGILLGFGLAAALVTAWVGGWMMGQRGQPIAPVVVRTSDQTSAVIVPPTPVVTPNASNPDADRNTFSEEVAKAWAAVAVKKDAESFDHVRLMIEQRLQSDPTFVHMRLPYLAYHCDFLTGFGAGLKPGDKIKRIDDALNFIADHGGAEGMNPDQAKGLEGNRQILVDLRKSLSSGK